MSRENSAAHAATLGPTPGSFASSRRASSSGASRRDSREGEEDSDEEDEEDEESASTVPTIYLARYPKPASRRSCSVTLRSWSRVGKA